MYQMQYEVISTLTKRLKLYGASVSGNKAVLVTRIQGLMGTVPPKLGVGSWYHFDKTTTEVELEKFCSSNHILVPSG